MNLSRRGLLFQTAGATAALAVLPGAGRAQSEADFPSRRVTIVAPSPVGGVSDLLARALEHQLSPIWQRAVIVENKPGASFQIGPAYVEKAPADGHTLL